MSPGFLGEHEYRIDNKGRIPIPPRFRAALKEGVVLAPGLEKCLRLYPLSYWQKIEERQETLPDSRSKWRTLKRYIFGKAFLTELDAQGRVTLPLSLRQQAGIGETVVVVGLNKYLELWDKAQWLQESATMEEEAPALFESIEENKP